MKKIIHIISRMNVGGPSKIINYYHENLYQFDFESIIICGKPSAEEGEIKPIQKPGLQVIYLEGLSPGMSIWNSLKAFISFLKIIRRIKPDIIHSHQAKAGFFGRLGGFLCRTPKTIHTYHGHVFYGYFSPLKTKLIIFIEKFLSFISDKSIAISPEIYQDITTKYKVCTPAKTILINVGIDTKLFLSLPPTSRGSFKIPADKFIIGFIGRLVKIKNPLAFISIAKELVKNKKDLHFVIAGDGNLKESVIQKIKEDKIENYFTILPWVDEIEKILGCIDLLVMTSLNEGTPLIIMEAMMMEVPVASTGVGGIPTLIEHEKTGYILTEKIEHNVKTLNNILENFDSKTINIISSAKEKILRHHSLELLLKETVEIYKTI